VLQEVCIDFTKLVAPSTCVQRIMARPPPYRYPPGQWKMVFSLITPACCAVSAATTLNTDPGGRSEEHTSELQSRENLVCRLLLEKKKRNVPHRAQVWLILC